jgi:glycosyltransferase involved in cell wall biosynthesis
MSISKPYLSVIVTNYNEQSNLESGALENLIKYLKTKKFPWELILVDDGSTDSTLKYLQMFAKKHSHVQVLANPHMGKAAGVISGALTGKGEVILFTDTDQSTPITEFDKFIPLLQKGFSVIIGSRPSRPGAPLFRQVLAYGMVVFRTLILQLPYKDTQCGFKALKSDAAKRIFNTMKQVHPLKTITYPTTNPGFDLEILFLARKFGYQVGQVPVKWTYRESKRVSFVKDAINGIKELLIVRYRAMTNIYQK